VNEAAGGLCYDYNGLFTDCLLLTVNGYKQPKVVLVAEKRVTD